jgi:hypothetical protein
MMTVKPIHRAETVSAVRESVTRTLGIPAASYLARLLMELCSYSAATQDNEGKTDQAQTSSRG